MFPLAEKTLALVKQERKVTADVLEHLRLIDAQKIYARMGYRSLWDFTTKYLGYSEAAAYRRISAMRFVRGQPELSAKIRTGELSLTTAAKAQTVVVQGKIGKSDVIESIAGKSSREADLSLLKLSPQTAKPQTRALDMEYTEIRLVVDRQLKVKLDKLRNLRAHKNPSQNYLDIINDLVELGLRHWDPAQRRSSAPSAGKSRRPTSSVEAFVWKRDEGKCMECGSTHMLEMDHIIRWSEGGKSTPENLRLLCRVHNQLRNSVDVSE